MAEAAHSRELAAQDMKLSETADVNDGAGLSVISLEDWRVQVALVSCRPGRIIGLLAGSG